MKKIISTVVLAALALVGTVATASTVAAKPSPKVELFGQGDYETDEWGRTAVHATVTGRPFDGSFSAGLQLAHDQFPDPGTCRDADPLFVVWEGHRSLDFISWGEICAVEPGGVVEFVYTGAFDLYETSGHRGLVGTDGWLEMRLMTDGSAAVTIVDS